MRRMMAGMAFVLVAALVGIGCGGSWVESYCNVWQEENYSYMECPVHVFTASGPDSTEFDDGDPDGDKPSKLGRVEQPLIDSCPAQVQTADGAWALIYSDLTTCRFFRELESGVAGHPIEIPTHQF